MGFKFGHCPSSCFRAHIQPTGAGSTTRRSQTLWPRHWFQLRRRYVDQGLINHAYLRWVSCLYLEEGSSIKHITPFLQVNLRYTLLMGSKLTHPLLTSSHAQGNVSRVELTAAADGQMSITTQISQQYCLMAALLQARERCCWCQTTASQLDAWDVVCLRAGPT